MCTPVGDQSARQTWCLPLQQMRSVQRVSTRVPSSMAGRCSCRSPLGAVQTATARQPCPAVFGAWMACTTLMVDCVRACGLPQDYDGQGSSPNQLAASSCIASGNRQQWKVCACCGDAQGSNTTSCFTNQQVPLPCVHQRAHPPQAGRWTGQGSVEQPCSARPWREIGERHHGGMNSCQQKMQGGVRAVARL